MHLQPGFVSQLAAANIFTSWLASTLCVHYAVPLYVHTHHAMLACGGMGVCPHTFPTLALDGREIALTTRLEGDTGCEAGWTP
jgi:hypothetical protein